jgi:hypothetical protein
MKINRGIMMAVVAIAGWQSRANAQIVKVDLGSAEGFAVLAGTSITNIGSTVVNGDLGVYPGATVTGFYPPGVVNGTIYPGGSVAQQAQIDAQAAFNTLTAETPRSNLTGTDLGGLTLTSGVYSDSVAQMTGTLTLDAGGNPNALFYFQIGTTLTTANNSMVSLINGAQADNVFWQVGSSATLGIGSDFSGSLLAATSITLNNGVDLSGRAFALGAAVTLDSNTISTPAAAVPEPATTSALIAGFSGLLIGIRRIRSITTRRADL